MLKLFYTLLTNPLGLPIAPLWEYIILLIVGEIVHEIAFHISPGGEFGSPIYWFTKAISCFMVWAVLYVLIASVQFVVAHWIWFLIAVALIIVVIVVIYNYNY